MNASKGSEGIVKLRTSEVMPLHDAPLTPQIVRELGLEEKEHLLRVEDRVLRLPVGEAEEVGPEAALFLPLLGGGEGAEADLKVTHVVRRQLNLHVNPLREKGFRRKVN